MLRAIENLGWNRHENHPQRGCLIARNGIVASTNPYTSQVGLDTLRRGGNAVDAAVAMGATHIVVEPGCGHLGGDTFMLIHLAEQEKTVALNGSGAAPQEANAAFYQSLGGIPDKGPLAASIPGSVSCWQYANEAFGSLSFSSLLEPASALARDGFAVQNRLGRYLKRVADVFLQYEGSARQYYDADGKPPLVGDILRQPWLANSIDAIAKQGRSAFYEGDLTKTIVDYWRSIGGLFSLEDFSAHRTYQETPLSAPYRGYDILQQPLPSQGMMVLIMLNIMEQFPVNEWGPGSAKAIHHMLEAKKLVFELCEQYLGDPEQVDVPLEKLLDKGFAAELASRIDPLRSRDKPHPEHAVVSDTDYFCVVDKDRNVVSYIHSLFSGCGVTVPEVGAMFNSRMLGFSLEDNHPNVMAPGKRPIHTLNSWIISKDGKPQVVGGVTAGDLQVQFNLQLISWLIDGGCQLHEAFDAPRWGNRIEDQVTLEDREQSDTINELKDRGHHIETQPAWGATGRGHAIAIDHERNILIGYTESRDDGGWVMGY